MQGGIQAARLVPSAPAWPLLDPGSEALQRNSGGCSCSYSYQPVQKRHVRQIQKRGFTQPHIADLSIHFETKRRGQSQAARKQRGRQAESNHCTAGLGVGGEGQELPLRQSQSRQRRSLRNQHVPGMNSGGNFYRRPSLERGLLLDDDLSRVEALYVADAAVEPEARADPPWQPVLRSVLTACLASFLFGYHVGVVNGPLEYIARDLGFAGSNVLKGAVVSATLAGAFLGSIGGGTMAEAFGRRRTFQLNALPLLVGAATSASASTVGAMVAGRFAVGVGLGIATAVLPLYITEISPSRFRGTMGSLNQLCGCSGILVALILSLPIRSSPGWWRNMFWIACLPAIALAGGMASAAESPRWLFQRGRLAETERTIARLWGPAAVGDAMADLKAAAQGSAGQEASWRDLIRPRYIKVVAIGCAMFALQQLSGINAIFYFSSTVFHNAGVKSQFLANVGLGLVNFAGAVAAMMLQDRWGRRKALRLSYSGMAAALLISSGAMTLPFLRPWAGPLSVVATLAFVLAFCLGAGPVPALLLPEMFPTRIRSRALAACMACHWVFNFGIGLYFLEVVRLVGLPAVYFGFAMVALATVAFSQRCIVETQGKSLEEIERMLAGGH